MGEPEAYAAHIAKGFVVVSNSTCLQASEHMLNLHHMNKSETEEDNEPGIGQSSSSEAKAANSSDLFQYQPDPTRFPLGCLSNGKKYTEILLFQKIKEDKGTTVRHVFERELQGS